MLMITGELEETIAQTFVRAANLRTLLSKSDCPDALKYCEPMFRKLVQPTQDRGTLLSDIASMAAGHSPDIPDDEDVEEEDGGGGDGTPISLGAGTRAAMSEFINPSHIPVTAVSLSSFRLDGALLTSLSTHVGNSQVLFQSSTDPSPVPGRVEKIFKLQTTGPDYHFVTLRRHKPVVMRRDPFAQFPILGAKFWSPEFEPLEVYPLKFICYQYAYCPITLDDKAVAIILSLNRSLTF
jgi:hypothetical protein